MAVLYADFKRSTYWALIIEVCLLSVTIVKGTAPGEYTWIHLVSLQSLLHSKMFKDPSLPSSGLAGVKGNGIVELF